MMRDVRSASIIGNTGKLGEELLNALLESPLYSKVRVGVRKAMRSHVPKPVGDPMEGRRLY